MPALTRSRRMSRSNSAKTASIPARALPLGVVRSSASLRETKPTLSDDNSCRVLTKSTRDRPQRSSRQTTTRSMARFRASTRSSSRFCRSDAPDPMSFTSTAISQPRFRAYWRMAVSCIGNVCWSCVETLAYSPARTVFSPWPKTLFRGAFETLDFGLVSDTDSSMA